jgi:hypothetical protein
LTVSGDRARKQGRYTSNVSTSGRQKVFYFSRSE